MYDVCDVLHASYCSADVANHVLREYGEGSMGKGIRKLAGEMLTIGGQQSYGIGYDAGVSDTYPTAFKDGVVTVSLICVCAIGLIGFGVWCTKKLIEHHNAKKEENQLFLLDQLLLIGYNISIASVAQWIEQWFPEPC